MAARFKWVAWSNSKRVVLISRPWPPIAYERLQEIRPGTCHWFKTHAASSGRYPHSSGTVSALLSGQPCPGDVLCVGPVRSMDISP